MYEAVRAAHINSVWSKRNAVQVFAKHLLKVVADALPLTNDPTVRAALYDCYVAVLEADSVVFSFPEVDCSQLTLKDRAGLRDFLRVKQRFLENDGEATDVLAEALSDATCDILGSVSLVPGEPRTSLHVSLFRSLDDLNEVVNQVIARFVDEKLQHYALCNDLRRQLYDNACAASGINPEREINKPLLAPRDSRLPAEELVQAYLGNTPFLDLLKVPIPFHIRDRDYGEHVLICAGPGHGKTQLIQTLIADFLDKDDPPSLVLIDPTGAIIDRVQRLALFEHRLRDRILIIDPAQSPSLGMFDMSTPRFERYSPEQKQDMQSEVIGLFSYIFKSDEYDLSSHMELPFTYAVRLMLSRPGSTIVDLRKLLEEAPPKKAPDGYGHSAYKDDIDKLDEAARDFFQHHFFDDALAGTRSAIARRLHKLLGVPAFERMFAASANTLDLFDEMQKGTIVLVNTNPQILKYGGHLLFARYVIMRALTAAYERSLVRPEDRKQAFLMIDEASQYTDNSIEELLTKVRQFKLGVMLAYQHLDHKELNDNIRSALYGSTAVKFVGGASFNDRRRLAREMETTPEFIGAQRRDGSDKPQWSQFACYVRNYTDKAVSLTIPFYRLENMPTMTDEAHRMLLAENKKRVSAIAAPAPKHSAPVMAAETAAALLKAVEQAVAPTPVQVAQTPKSPPPPAPKDEHW